MESKGYNSTMCVCLYVEYWVDVQIYKHLSYIAIQWVYIFYLRQNLSIILGLSSAYPQSIVQSRQLTNKKTKKKPPKTWEVETNQITTCIKFWNHKLPTQLTRET